MVHLSFIASLHGTAGQDYQYRFETFSSQEDDIVFAVEIA